MKRRVHQPPRNRVETDARLIDYYRLYEQAAREDGAARPLPGHRRAAAWIASSPSATLFRIRRLLREGRMQRRGDLFAATRCGSCHYWELCGLRKTPAAKDCKEHTQGGLG